MKLVAWLSCFSLVFCKDVPKTVVTNLDKLEERNRIWQNANVHVNRLIDDDNTSGSEFTDSVDRLIAATEQLGLIATKQIGTDIIILGVIHLHEFLAQIPLIKKHDATRAQQLEDAINTAKSAQDKIVAQVLQDNEKSTLALEALDFSTTAVLDELRNIAVGKNDYNGFMTCGKFHDGDVTSDPNIVGSLLDENIRTLYHELRKSNGRKIISWDVFEIVGAWHLQRAYMLISTIEEKALKNGIVVLAGIQQLKDVDAEDLDLTRSTEL